MDDLLDILAGTAKYCDNGGLLKMLKWINSSFTSLISCNKWLCRDSFCN